MNFWSIPSSHVHMSHCDCGDPDCRRCYPHRQLMVAICPECTRAQQEDNTECEACGESMDDAHIRPERPGDFDPS